MSEPVRDSLTRAGSDERLSCEPPCIIGKEEDLSPLLRDAANKKERYLQLNLGLEHQTIVEKLPRWYLQVPRPRPQELTRRENQLMCKVLRRLVLKQARKGYRILRPLPLFDPKP